MGTFNLADQYFSKQNLDDLRLVSSFKRFLCDKDNQIQSSTFVFVIHVDCTFLRVELMQERLEEMRCMLKYFLFVFGTMKRKIRVSS